QPGRLAGGACAPSARRRLAWFVRGLDGQMGTMDPAPRGCCRVLHGGDDSARWMVRAWLGRARVPADFTLFRGCVIFCYRRVRARDRSGADCLLVGDCEFFGDLSV